MDSYPSAALVRYGSRFRPVATWAPASNRHHLALPKLRVSRRAARGARGVNSGSAARDTGRGLTEAQKGVGLGGHDASAMAIVHLCRGERA
jgi:hypothetical protein